MTDGLCPVCGSLMFDHAEHVCPDAFTVWCVYVQQPTKIRALSHQAAALLWADLYGQASQHIPHVRVTRDRDDNTKWFEITGEVAITYQAAETEEPKTWTSMPPKPTPPKPTPPKPTTQT